MGILGGGEMKGFIGAALCFLCSLWISTFIFELIKPNGWIKLPLVVSCIVFVWVSTYIGAYSFGAFD